MVGGVVGVGGGVVGVVGGVVGGVVVVGGGVWAVRYLYCMFGIVCCGCALAHQFAYYPLQLLHSLLLPRQPILQPKYTPFINYHLYTAFYYSSIDIFSSYFALIPSICSVK